MNSRRVAIVAGCRTPFARSGTVYRDLTALDLALPYVTKIAIDNFIVPLTGSETLIADGEKKSTQRYIRADLSDPQQQAVKSSG